VDTFNRICEHRADRLPGLDLRLINPASDALLVQVVEYLTREILVGFRVAQEEAPSAHGAYSGLCRLG